MAGPTTQQLSDRLDGQERRLGELERSVYGLVERVDTARRDIKHIQATLNRMAELLTKLTTQQAVLEARCSALEKTVEEVKKALEERARKQWLLWVAVIAAVFALVGNLAVALLRK